MELTGNRRTSQLAARPFDVYALPFVPQELRSVNLQPAIVFESRPARTINFEAYASSFIPPLFQHRHPTADDLIQKTRDYSQLNPNQPVPLSPETYAMFFCNSLHDEVHALNSEISNYSLYGVTLFLRHHKSGVAYCVLHVPGIRDNTPHLELEDVVSLRQVANEPWSCVPHTIFRGFQYNARVHEIEKATELVKLRISDSKTLYTGMPIIMNVSFNSPSTRIEAQQLSLALIQESLGHMASTMPNADPTTRHASNGVRKASGPGQKMGGQWEASWIRHMLFPEVADGDLQTELTRLAKRKLFDNQLNFEQQKAVDSICRQNYGEVPFLISGPPGTGKTKTIIECSLQLVSNDSRILHVLLCAPSDPAADTLAQRISKHLPFGDFLRLNGPTRTFAEVPEKLMLHCFIENDHFALPPLPQLMAYKIVVTTCRDAAMLVSAGLTNRDLFALEHGVMNALHHGQASRKQTLHWGALMIDEAAQATESEAAIAISIAVPPPEAAESIAFNPILAMAGDHMQLGPRAKTPALKISLFERLLNRKLYKEHPLARGKNTTGAAPKPLDKAMLPITRPPFSNLIRNYRSHPAVLAVPSALFYHDTLHPCAVDIDSLRSWSGWKGRGWPVLFMTNMEPDEVESEGGGWYNVAEAHIACSTAQSLVRSGLIDERDICIMSPFHAQVRLVRSMIREMPYGMSRVNIGPMEAFQGLESRLVILCTTRTRTRFLGRDLERGVGIVHEKKRFNVALTRAKEGLIVIGNPYLLSVDSCWAAFVGFCARHRLFSEEYADEGSEYFTSAGGLSLGPGLDAGAGADSDRHISSLEKGLVSQEAINQDITSDHFTATMNDDEMWVVGMVAALTMDDEEGEADHFENEQANGDGRGFQDGEVDEASRR